MSNSLISRSKWWIALGVLVALIAVLFTRSPLFGSLYTSASFTVKELSEAELSARLHGKRALIVGGTKGIGLGFARSMAKRGANMTIAGRSDGNSIVNELKKLSKSYQSDHEFLKADLSLAKSSSAFSKTFASTHPKLDYLIITTGIIPDSVRRETEEGIQEDFAVSFFSSRFVLIHEMLDYLIKSKTRIILLGVFDFNGGVDLSDIQLKNDYGVLKALSTGHVANAMLINEIAKREKAIEIFGFTPGIVNSEAYRTWTGDTWKGWLLDKVVSLGGKSIDDYAETMIHTVVTRELSGKSGLFFDKTGTSHQSSQWLQEADNSLKFYQYCISLMADVLAKM